MPTELDPMQQSAYEAYKQRKAEYDQALTQAPERTKPGFWRSLAAIGAGAFGGSQYDRGGLQWGQQMAQEINEGPYQRRMNDHLRQLAAKRQGLDVAQEGMQVMGQIEDRKQRAAQQKQDSADRNTSRNREQQGREDVNAAIYDRDVQKRSQNMAIAFGSREELEASPDAVAKLATGGWAVSQRPGFKSVHLEPSGDTIRKANYEPVELVANNINRLLENNLALRERGYPIVTMEMASKAGIVQLNNMFKEMNDMLNNRELARSNAANRRGDGVERESPDTKRAWSGHDKTWASAESNQTKLIAHANNLGIRIARELDPNTKNLLVEELKNTSRQMAANLNNAHRTDPLRKVGEEKSYTVDETQPGFPLIETRGGQKTEKSPTAASQTPQPEEWVKDASGKYVRAKRAGQ